MFQVIQRITSSLSSGHQSKREVDFILDQCFETSSMMHYHAREEIFVTVKKVIVTLTDTWLGLEETNVLKFIPGQLHLK